MKNLWIGAIAALVIAGGYFAFRGDPVSETPDAIRIGVIAPLTGIAADYGAEMKAGIEAAGGTNVTFIYEDDCAAHEGDGYRGSRAVRRIRNAV